MYGKLAKLALKNNAEKSRAFVFTFDDGPIDSLTPTILDLLDKYNAKASFFLLGRNIAGREQIVRQIADMGHEICSHGFDHLNYLKILPWRTIADIKKGWKAIDAALEVNRGKYPFRPPCGKLNVVSLIYLLSRKVPIVYWTFDSGDSWKAKPDTGRTAKFLEISEGAVILYHDYKRSSEKSESWMLESLRLSLEKAKQKCMREQFKDSSNIIDKYKVTDLINRK